MTTVDGDRLPGSVPNVPGATLNVLELESVRTGRTRGELVALAVDAMFSTAAAPSPAGAVDGGQGATRPPAPTIAPKVLLPIDADQREHSVCTHPHEPGWIVTTCQRRPSWWLHPIGHPDDQAHACCDDHIPDGWVKTSDTIATPLPHVHLDGTDPALCVYGDRCGQ